MAISDTSSIILYIFPHRLLSASALREMNVDIKIGSGSEITINNLNGAFIAESDNNSIADFSTDSTLHPGNIPHSITMKYYDDGWQKNSDGEKLSGRRGSGREGESKTGGLIEGGRKAGIKDGVGKRGESGNGRGSEARGAVRRRKGSHGSDDRGNGIEKRRNAVEAMGQEESVFEYRVTDKNKKKEKKEKMRGDEAMVIEPTTDTMLNKTEADDGKMTAEEKVSVNFFKHDFVFLMFAACFVLIAIALMFMPDV